jgi:casein kinase II subunit beta
MFLFNDLVVKSAKPRGQKRRRSLESRGSCSEWVQRFTQANPWLCSVEDSYINDNFNLYGLSNDFDDYSSVLKIIRGSQPDHGSSRKLQSRAEILYGLIHARYILTFHGIKEMQPKYDGRLYGTCPRVACNEQPLLRLACRR